MGSFFRTSHINPAAASSPGAETTSSFDRAVRPGRPTMTDAACLQSHILAISWDVAVAAESANFSLDLVARTARVSKRTIYARFASKDDLVRAMIGHRIGDFIAALRHDGTDAPLADRLAAQAANAITYLTSIEGYVLSRLIESLPNEPKGGKASARIGLYQSVTEAFVDVLASALGRALPSQELNFAAGRWMEGIEGRSRMLLAGLDHGDPAEWSQSFAHSFLLGLSRP